MTEKPAAETMKNKKSRLQPALSKTMQIHKVSLVRTAAFHAPLHKAAEVRSKTTKPPLIYPITQSVRLHFP
ncbi:MAG: hypothetical protein K2P27_11695 [Lachnospiraceae bacterium]|nr:hypothetical protein [Lachnospiraceae bacterium]